MVEPATGDLFVSMLYEDTVSTARPEAALPEGRQVPQQRRRKDGGHGDDHPRHVRRSAGAVALQISNTSIGPDGKLYRAHGRRLSARNGPEPELLPGQDPAMNLDGSAPADNPFYDAGDGITATRLRLRIRLPQSVRGRVAGGRRSALRGGERAPGRPVRKGRPGPELRLGRLRPEHDELRPLQLGSLARAGEHRLRPARDCVGKRHSRSRRWTTRSSPSTARMRPGRRSAASASSSSSRMRAAPSTAPPPCR